MYCMPGLVLDHVPQTGLSIIHMTGLVREQVCISALKALCTRDLVNANAFQWRRCSRRTRPPLNMLYAPPYVF